jgi:hypothetical protein
MVPDSAWQKWGLEAALAHQKHHRLQWWHGHCTRRLEDWVGKSSDEIDRGGRPRHLLADRGQAGDGSSDADSGGGAPPPRGRGRPARPDPVVSDTDEQAAVLSRLRYAFGMYSSFGPRLLAACPTRIGYELFSC